MDAVTKVWAKHQGIKQLLIFTETGEGSCNLGCSYCFLAKRGEHKVMARETLFRAIDFLREIAVEPPSLHFFGTEPLKRFDLIRAAREYAPDMPISLTTNGTLLTRERMEWMTENDVRIYVFSIDGGEQHNALRVDRHGRPAWPLIERGLRIALEYQSQWLTARGSWYPSDYDLVSRFKALEELGARSIAMVPVNNGPFDEDRVYEAYLALGEHYGWGWTPSKFVNEMIKRCQNEEAVPQAGNGCGVGTGYWAVSPDGRLSLCQLYEEKPEMALGDIWQGITNPEPFWTVSWRVDTFHKPENPYPKPQCRTCTAYKHCMGVGFCAGINAQDTGDELVPPDGYCNHLRGFVRACRVWAQKMAERDAGKAQHLGKTLVSNVLGRTYPSSAEEGWEWV